MNLLNRVKLNKDTGYKNDSNGVEETMNWLGLIYNRSAVLVLFGIILLILFLSVNSGSQTPGEGSLGVGNMGEVFQLESWETTVDKEGRYPILRLKFDLLDDVSMELLDEDKDAISSAYIYEDEKKANLAMSDYKFAAPINPKPGTYTLVVRSHGKLVNKTEFTFGGPKLKLVNQESTWYTRCVFGVDPCVKEYKVALKFNLKNCGDLPIYISHISDIYLDGGRWDSPGNIHLEDGVRVQHEWDFEPGKEHWGGRIDIARWILPGETEVIKQEKYPPGNSNNEYNISRIPVDGRQHKLTMAFKDAEENVLLPIAIKNPN
jgi:hypothetical protein